MCGMTISAVILFQWNSCQVDSERDGEKMDAREVIRTLMPASNFLACQCSSHIAVRKCLHKFQSSPESIQIDVSVNPLHSASTVSQYLRKLFMCISHSHSFSNLWLAFACFPDFRQTRYLLSFDDLLLCNRVLLEVFQSILFTKLSMNLSGRQTPKHTLYLTAKMCIFPQSAVILSSDTEYSRINFW